MANARLEAAQTTRARAANFARVGNDHMANLMIQGAERYESMTDAEYSAYIESLNTPARSAAARRMASQIAN